MLRQSNGISRVAKALQIARTTLWRLVRSLMWGNGLSAPRIKQKCTRLWHPPSPAPFVRYAAECGMRLQWRLLCNVA